MDVQGMCLLGYHVQYVSVESAGGHDAYHTAGTDSARASGKDGSPTTTTVITPGTKQRGRAGRPGQRSSEGASRGNDGTHPAA